MENNLFKNIELLSYDNLGILISIKECLEDRIEWLEDREPESDGTVYDDWSEKTEELRYIVDQIEETIEQMDEMINEIKNMVKDYQQTYGGLSRLKI